MNVKSSEDGSRLLDLERFLPYRLNVAAEAVSAALARRYAERCGITVPEWRVIATIGQYGEMTAKAIGRHSRMHKTKVSRAANALARRGLLSRLANKHDRREAFLALTPSGRGIYETIAPDAIGFTDGLLAGIDAQDRDRLERLLIEIEARANRVLNGQG